MGVHEVCGSLCKYSDFRDGTHNLHDALIFNIAIDERIKSINQSTKG